MEEYDIPMTAVPVNEPKKVVFIVPSGLPAGDYKLRLATQYTSGGKLLKEPRAYLFNCILKAEPVVHSPQEQIVHAPVNESFTPR
jgi:hypothetical protein